MLEAQNLEWKEFWRDEHLKWVCGFANAQGGKIYTGMNDEGKILGVSENKKLSEDGKEYIEIAVSPSSYPVNYRGEYHYRSGSTKQSLRGCL